MRKRKSVIIFLLVFCFTLGFSINGSTIDNNQYKLANNEEPDPFDNTIDFVN